LLVLQRLLVLLVELLLHSSNSASMQVVDRL
jgi:hypothetical protein